MVAGLPVSEPPSGTVVTCSAVPAGRHRCIVATNDQITHPPSQLPIRMLPPDTGVEFDSRDPPTLEPRFASGS